MNHIPTLKFWIQHTSTTFGIRSSSLRAVDAAIEKYEKNKIKSQQPPTEQTSLIDTDNTSLNLIEIGFALDRWKKAQGLREAWKSSPRNKTGVITKLNAIVGTPEIDISTDNYKENLAHARLGIIYLFSHLNVDTNILSLMVLPAALITGTALSQVSVEGNDLFSDRSKETFNATHAAMRDLRFGADPAKGLINAIEDGIKVKKQQRSDSLIKKIVDVLEGFVKQVLKTLVELFYRQDSVNGPYVIQTSLMLSLTKATIASVAIILCNAIGNFTTDVTRLARHLARIADAAVDGIRSWWQSQFVNILYGHPSAICASLKSRMSAHVRLGIYNSMKATAGIAIQLLFPLIGEAVRAVGNIILSIFEMIYNFLECHVRLHNIRGVIHECQGLWEQYQSNKLLPINERKKLMHEDVNRFAAWYSEIARTSTELAALTLNSGICGDKMHFLNMFDTTLGKLIKQDAFDKASNYMELLKDYSGNFLRTSNYIITSEDPMVQAYINHAKEIGLGNSNKLWAMVKKITEA
ncbi:MAG: hypothetical protein KAH18_07705 [Psychromonas sp.]|nr:hypothetical protein [Psychromonas sp.]